MLYRILTLVVFTFLANSALADSVESSPMAAAKPELKTVLKSQLERVDETEVVLSHVKIPPNSSLPKHWHPGEEFAYILKGQLTVWMKDQGKTVMNEGDAAKVPLKAIHSAGTGDEGATLLVFRVHEKGQPERVLVTE